MTNPRFVQIHTLHSYQAVLLNRDDTGNAKSINFGGTTRTRISSQCLKRHWKTANDKFSIYNISDNSITSIRSRNIINECVIQPLRNNSYNNEEVLDAIQNSFNIGIYGEKGSKVENRQILILGEPEIEYLRNKASTIFYEHPDNPTDAGKKAKGLFGDKTKNFETFRKNIKMPGGIDAALFGRMVTSDSKANIDAPIHVQHSLTVHSEENELDYFTAIDDFPQSTGAAHIGETELTSGLFYGYVVVDVPGLVANLSDNREMASDVIKNLIHLIATVTPGAKLGSTAPYSRADLVMVEIGDVQPRTLANAFRIPVEAQVENATIRLSEYLNKQDNSYGRMEIRKMMSVDNYELPGAELLNMDNLANWVAKIVKEGDNIE